MRNLTVGGVRRIEDKEYRDINSAGIMPLATIHVLDLLSKLPYFLQLSQLSDTLLHYLLSKNSMLLEGAMASYENKRLPGPVI